MPSSSSKGIIRFEEVPLESRVDDSDFGPNKWSREQTHDFIFSQPVQGEPISVRTNKAIAEYIGKGLIVAAVIGAGVYFWPEIKSVGQTTKNVYNFFVNAEWFPQ